jgi:hypothetical protein
MPIAATSGGERPSSSPSAYKGPPRDVVKALRLGEDGPYTGVVLSCGHTITFERKQKKVGKRSCCPQCRGAAAVDVPAPAPRPSTSPRAAPETPAPARRDARPGIEELRDLERRLAGVPAVVAAARKVLASPDSRSVALSPEARRVLEGPEFASFNYARHEALEELERAMRTGGFLDDLSYGGFRKGDDWSAVRPTKKSRGAGEPGSRGAGEPGSRGAGEPGSREVSPGR